MSLSQIRVPTYQFRLEFSEPAGPRVLEVPLEKNDFAPAIDAAFLAALRRGRFAEYLPPSEGVRLVPRFVRGGEPVVSGFRVLLPTPDGGAFTADFEVGVFQGLARRIMVDLAREGKLPLDATLVYHLAARPEREENPALGLSLTFDDPEPLVPIRAKSRAALGKTVGWDNPSADDLPVLVHRSVLVDALDEARRRPECEVGGFLLGHLCHDPGSGELFLEVTCHVPAQATEATETSVTFTADSWAHARGVVNLRGEGEVFVGWVHSHPFRFCADCPSPPKPECIDKVLFFSADDTFLMGLAFAQPFMVGLQTAVEPRLEQALGHFPVRLYGWRDAEVVPRGFEVIED
jgi:proteasome lid subunit RPN8/RPN11